MKPLGSKESIEATSSFLPPDTYTDGVTAEELLAWSQPRADSEVVFRPLLTRQERLILEGYNFVDAHAGFGKAELPFRAGSIPLKWQLILETLREGGIPIHPQVPLFIKISNDAPKRYQAGIMVDTLENFSDGTVFIDGINAQGLSNNPDIAASKAIGEALERYLLTVYRRKDLRFASIRTLRKKHEVILDPMLYPQFTEEQIRYFPDRLLTEDKTLGWVRGKSLLDNKPTWLPAQMVYWNYAFEYNGYREPMIMEPNTNGAGAHFTRTRALLSGLRELIQRDAFLLFWLHRVAPPRIDPTTIQDAESSKLLTEFARCAIRVEICDLTIDTKEPVIVVGLIDESGKGPALCIAAGCHRDLELAIQGALQEVLACYQSGRYNTLEQMLPEVYRAFFSEGVGQRERLTLAANPDRISEYLWFFTGTLQPMVTGAKNSLTSEEELQDILAVFREKHWPVYSYEVAHPLLKKLGYVVTHVIAPHLLSLYLNEMNAPLGYLRLTKDFPQEKIGNMNKDILNPVPHPFP